MSSNLSKGIFFAILTAFISGFSNFINKIAVTTIKPPLVFTAEKNLLVGLAIIGILIATCKWKKIFRLKKKEIIFLILIGIIGGSLPFYLFFTGLSQIPAINAAFIHKTLVLWVAILAIPFLKEKISKLQIFAVLLLFSSNFIIGGFTSLQFSQGELFVLIATILWAIENILAKKILPFVDPDIVVAARMGLGSLILLGAALLTSPTALYQSLFTLPSQWLLMGITTIFLLGYVMTWYRALKFAPAITVASILVAATLVTNILSAIFITHTWTIEMGAQSLATFLGIGFLWFVNKKQASNANLAHN